MTMELGPAAAAVAIQRRLMPVTTENRTRSRKPSTRLGRLGSSLWAWAWAIDTPDEANEIRFGGSTSGFGSGNRVPQGQVGIQFRDSVSRDPVSRQPVFRHRVFRHAVKRVRNNTDAGWEQGESWPLARVCSHED